LKIDRAFIKGIDESDATRAVVKGIITIAHGVGMDVCAEGVEQPEQLAVLRELDCDIVSGWLFAPALAPTPIRTSSTVGPAGPGGPDTVAVALLP